MTSHHSCHLCQLSISILLLLYPILGSCQCPSLLVMSVEEALRLQNKTFTLSSYVRMARAASDCYLPLGLHLVPLFRHAVPVSRLSCGVVVEHHLPKAAVVQGLLHCTKDGTRCEEFKNQFQHSRGVRFLPRANASLPCSRNFKPGLVTLHSTGG